MMIWRDDTGRETPVNGCDAFEATLPDYLDETLAPDAAREAAAHAAACTTCRALVRDLQEIRTQARALPALRPARDLWQGIEARIASPSAHRSDVSTRAAERPVGARVSAMRRWFGPQYATRVSALAAGLVIATAGITYMATRALVGSPHGPALTSPANTIVVAGPARSVAQTSEYIYDAQITSLHQILEQRRARLDPKTVAVIEHNLAVIDTAIAQSKQALQHDPANGFLADQLDRDLNTKLELLRTVALLPSRT